MPIQRLSREDRLRLVRFVCSFAWLDFEIAPAERAFIQKLVGRLDLHKEERAQVARWLESPPSPDEVDPNLVPRAHRQLFLDAVTAVAAADGRITPEEQEMLKLFSALIGKK